MKKPYIFTQKKKLFVFFCVSRLVFFFLFLFCFVFGFGSEKSVSHPPKKKKMKPVVIFLLCLGVVFSFDYTLSCLFSHPFPLLISLPLPLLLFSHLSPLHSNHDNFGWSWTRRSANVLWYVREKFLFSLSSSPLSSPPRIIFSNFSSPPPLPPFSSFSSQGLILTPHRGSFAGL